MAKFYCALSGIECEVSYIPMSLNSREYAHPIFFLPKPKLLGLFSRFESGNLGDIESYLLYLALFNSTDMVEFTVPATYDPKQTPQLVASYLEPLCDIVYKLDAIRVPSFQAPKFRVTPETKNLKNSGVWIQVWQHAFKDFLEGNKNRLILEELSEIETRVHRLILNPNAHPAKYASVLAVWAAKAANFPTYITEYWQEIIRKCVSEKAIFDVPKVDIEELIEHLEDNLELGTIYSQSLFTLLRDGKKKQVSYLGLGDMDLINLESPYTILDDSSSIEVANMQTVFMQAPQKEPTRNEYPSEFEYQRARIRFMAASRNTQNSQNL